MNGRRVTRLDELARDVPPARDLWPGISAAIAAEQATTGVATAARRSFWRPTSALAAAAALVAFGVFLGLQFGNPTVVMPVASTTTGDPAVIPTSLQRDAAYRQQRDELAAQVQVRLNSMTPAERDKVAGSLATLRRSINEIEAALGRDPANALLQELLVGSCQEEMRALTAVRDSGNQET